MTPFLFRLHDLAPVLNHLWQSTVFLFAAGTVTLALRRHQARTRYWIWFAASAKFLLPFALLLSLGSHLARPHPRPADPGTLTIAMEQVSEPFALPEASPIAAPIPTRASLTELLPIAAATLWLAGVLAVLTLWAILWHRVAAQVRRAVPLTEGREAELLRRMEQTAGLRHPIRLLAVSPSQNITGPGIYGIFRPTLLWPPDLSPRLDDAHLEAILAHEIAHVLRRDNLAAALHMLVEVLFWFHPLVWMLGSRLEAERERACDEAVLTLCAQPRIYAESLLAVAEFFVESPLPCLSGVTGADLKHRMSAILAGRTARPLTLLARLGLFTLAAATLAIPLVVGAQTANQTNAAQPDLLATGDWMAAAGTKLAFDVASIRLDTLGIPPQGPPPQTNVDLDPGDLYQPTGGVLRMKNKSLRTLIAFAWKMNGNQQLFLKEHVPEFVLADRFDMEARTDLPNPTKDQLRLMMQSLLADRFKLVVHKESKESTILGLTPTHAGKLGPHIRPHPQNDPICANDLTKDRATWVPATDGYPLLCGSIVGMASTPNHQSLKTGGRNVPMRLIAEAMAVMGDTGLTHPVVDRTNLTGTFDFTLELDYTEMESTNTPNTAPQFLEELNDQLGLKLTSQKGPEDFYLVDHVERLSAQDAALLTAPPSPAVPAPAHPQLLPAAFVQSAPPTTPTPAPQPAATQTIIPYAVSSIRESKGGFQQMHLTVGLFHAQNFTLRKMIRVAYGTQESKVLGGPAWLDTKLFDIEAKSDDADLAAIKALPAEQRTAYVFRQAQLLLVERFHLQLHAEQRPTDVFALVVARGGPKLKASSDTSNFAQFSATTNPGSGAGIRGLGRGHIAGIKATTDMLANTLSQFAAAELGRPVVNLTGLPGTYDFNLQWLPDSTAADQDRLASADPAADPLLTAIQQQLGLKLEARKSPVEVQVIDHIDLPTEN